MKKRGMGFGLKLVLTQVAAVLVLVCVVGLSQRGLERHRAAHDVQYALGFRMSKTLFELQLLLQETRLLEMELANLDVPWMVYEKAKNFRAAVDLVTEGLHEAEANVAMLEVGEALRIVTLRWERYVRLASRTAAYALEGRREEARDSALLVSSADVGQLGQAMEETIRQMQRFVSAEQERLQGEEEAFSRRRVLIALGGVLLLTLTAAVPAWSMARRVRGLTEGAQRVAEGDLDRRVPVRGRDEIGTLALAFNRMLEAVHSRDEALKAHTRDLEEQRGLLQAEMTERQRVSERLEESARHLRHAQAVAHLGSWELDLDTDLLTWSEETCRIFETAPDRPPSTVEAFLDLVHPEDREEVTHAYQASLESRTPYAVDHRVALPDGRIKWVSERCDTLYHEDGRPLRSIGTVLDITDRKRAEEALQKSEEKYRLLAEHTADVIYTMDIAKELFVYASPSAERALGYTPEEILSLGVRDVLTQESYARQMEEILSTLAEGRRDPVLMELDAVHKDGRILPFEAHAVILFDEKGIPVEIQGVARDITERRAAEEKRLALERALLLSQKGESLARMAGAVAHHFNNLLGVVMGNLELGTLALSSGGDLAENIRRATHACRKASEISHLMLAYLGQDLGERGPVDLGGLCRETLRRLGGTRPSNIPVHARFPENGPFVEADGAQLRQALTNLLVNAEEALGDGPGEIAVAVSLLPKTEIPASRAVPSGWEPQRETYACLSVTDTGCGIPRDTMDKVFDPFFSTKFTGRGLGLPVALGIVKAHDGAMTLESAPGEGTTFRIFLPVIYFSPPPSKEAPPVAPGAGEEGRTVLVVDDEEMLRDLAVAMLKWAGYEVLEAADGLEAVTVFRENQTRVSCVLCDLTMPHMGGWETLAALRKIHPGIAVILASGYDEGSAMAGRQGERPQAFLQKPYGMRELVGALARARGVEAHED